MIHEVVQHLTEGGETFEDYYTVDYFAFLYKVSPGAVNIGDTTIASGDKCYVLHLMSNYTAENPTSALREMREELESIADEVDRSESDITKVHVMAFTSPPISRIMKHFGFNTTQTVVPEDYKEEAERVYLQWDNRPNANEKVRNGSFMFCHLSGQEFLQRFRKQAA